MRNPVEKITMPDENTSLQTVHATCVCIGDCGVLLRGRPGAGKSDLALRLIQKGAILVSDDQVLLRCKDGAVLASAPDKIAGLLEVRGVGICRFDYVETSKLSLIVDLDADHEPERLPDLAQSCCMLLGVSMPRFNLNPFEASATAKISALLQKTGRKTD